MTKTDHIMTNLKLICPVAGSVVLGMLTACQQKSGKEELKLFDQIANVVQRATCGSDMDARVYGVGSEKDNFGQILAEGIDSMEGRALKPAAGEK